MVNNDSRPLSFALSDDQLGHNLNRNLAVWFDGIGPDILRFKQSSHPEPDLRAKILLIAMGIAILIGNILVAENNETLYVGTVIVIVVEVILLSVVKLDIDTRSRLLIRCWSLFGMQYLRLSRSVDDLDHLAIFVSKTNPELRHYIHSIMLVKNRRRMNVMFDISAERTRINELEEVAETIAWLLRVENRGYVNETRFYWW